MNLIRPFLKPENYKYLTIGWAAIIFTVSTIPNLPQPEIADGQGFSIRFDYLFHFVVYFILGTLTAVWQSTKNPKIHTLRYVLVLFLGLVFALLDEWHQVLVPGRRFNPVDFYLNAIGFLAGFLFTYHYLIRHLMHKLGKFPRIYFKLFEPAKD
jgi:VanZ family protein